EEDQDEEVDDELAVQDRAVNAAEELGPAGVAHGQADQHGQAGEGPADPVQQVGAAAGRAEQVRVEDGQPGDGGRHPDQAQAQRRQHQRNKRVHSRAGPGSRGSLPDIQRYVAGPRTVRGRGGEMVWDGDEMTTPAKPRATEPLAASRGYCSYTPTAPPARWA